MFNVKFLNKIFNRQSEQIDLNEISSYNFSKQLFKYDFVMGLDESEYEKYLKRTYEIKLGKKLDLKHPKTYTEKIQWLKLFDTPPLKVGFDGQI